MSNCIDISNPHVIFYPDEIDGERFMQHVNKAKLVTAMPRHMTPEEEVFWWYLSDNVSLHNDAIIIVFGQGRSTHTWRDWRATVAVINKFMKKPKVVSLIFSDEFDNFATSSASYVHFKPEEPQP